MRSSFFHVVAAALLLASGARAAGPGRAVPGWYQEVREQAARDLHCPLEQVRVEQRGPNIEASGCGVTASYVQAGRGWRSGELPAGGREALDALRTQVRARAAGELGCPAEAIGLRLLPGNEVQVSGCGREASYIWCGGELTRWRAASPIGSGAGREEVFPDPDPTGIPPFNAGEMTHPTWLSGPAPVYTSQALAHHVSGLVVIKCIISAQGRPERCRVLKGLPYLDEAILASVRARRYSPATFHGQPVAVDYVFKLCLALPGGSKPRAH